MKKFFVILFAGVLLSTGVAYAATTSQEALLAEMISLLKSIGENLALLISTTGSKTDTSVAGSTDTAGSKTTTGSSVTVSTSKPTLVAASPFQITNPSPNSDVTWKVGETYSIEWNTTPSMGIISNTDYIDAYLVTVSSKTPIYKIAIGEKNAGKIKWTISEKNIVPGTYAIAVQSFANPLTRAYSGTIEIAAKQSATTGIGGGSITIEADKVRGFNCTSCAGIICPSGMRCVYGGAGECSCTGIGGAGQANSIIGGGSWSVVTAASDDFWSVGKTKEIKWTSAGSYKYVTIKLVNTATNKETLVSTMALNNGLKLWKIPTSLTPGSYKIKVYPYGFPEKAVTSGGIVIGNKAPVQVDQMNCKPTCPEGKTCYLYNGNNICFTTIRPY